MCASVAAAASSASPARMRSQDRLVLGEGPRFAPGAAKRGVGDQEQNASEVDEGFPDAAVSAGLRHHVGELGQRRVDARVVSCLERLPALLDRPLEASRTSGGRRCARSRAMWHSSRSRSSRISRMSDSAGSITRAPRYGSISTSPSRWRRMSASRTGVFDTPRSVAMRASTSCAPVRQRPGEDLVAELLVDAALQLCREDSLTHVFGDTSYLVLDRGRHPLVHSVVRI